MNIQRSAQATRLLSLDFLRGCAIILMVVFHFGYDLSLFGYTNYNTNTDMEWRIFRAIIVSAFLMAVGMSSYVAYYSGVNTQKLIKTVAKLVTVSLFISVSSYLMYPGSWVYFGIIHFVALALPLSVLFLHRPLLSCLLAAILLLGYFSDTVTLNVPWQWSVKYLGIPGHTVDLVSFTPWFAMVLLGSVVMHFQLLPAISRNSISQSIAFLGRHSLLIYLLHQPLLFTGFYIIEWIR